MNDERPGAADDHAGPGDTEPMETVDTTTDEPVTTSGSMSVDRTGGYLVHGLSHEGQIRELNEDSWRWEPLADDLALFCVADGMGGHDRGEVASKLAVQTLFEEASQAVAHTRARNQRALRNLIRESFAKANLSVLECGRDNDSNMGTTMTCAMIHDQCEAFLANVGDSRAYLLREGTMQQITRDHSLVAYLVQMGELTREQARTHPSGNILVRSVGSTEDVEIDVFHVDLNPGDVLLLCTDGLWSELPDEELLNIVVQAGSPKAACENLVLRANEAGGKDNITCLVVAV